MAWEADGGELAFRHARVVSDRWRRRIQEVSRVTPIVLYRRRKRGKRDRSRLIAWGAKHAMRCDRERGGSGWMRGRL